MGLKKHKIILYALFICLLCTSLSSANSTLPVYPYKPVTMSSRATTNLSTHTGKEINLVHQFEANEVSLDSWDMKYVSDTLFSNEATNSIVGSFRNYTANKDINSDFTAQFNGALFNYEYAGNRKTLRDLRERESNEEYELNKAFAKHIQYELGEYHFNKFVKYHPQIVKYVKQAEDLNVTITIAEPKAPGEKPTKIKLRADPFRKELKLKYSSPLFDSVVRYKLGQRTVSFNLQKNLAFATVAVDYNLTMINFSQKNFQQNFSLGLGKNIYRDVAINLSLSGRYMNKENLNYYHAGQMNSLGAFVALGMPL